MSSKSDGAPRYQPTTPGAEMGLGSGATHADVPHARGDDMGGASGWLLLAAFVLVAAVLAGVFYTGSGTTEAPQSQQSVIPIEDRQNMP